MYWEWSVKVQKWINWLWTTDNLTTHTLYVLFIYYNTILHIYHYSKVLLKKICIYIIFAWFQKHPHIMVMTQKYHKHNLVREAARTTEWLPWTFAAIGWIKTWLRSNTNMLTLSKQPLVFVMQNIYFFMSWKLSISKAYSWLTKPK